MRKSSASAAQRRARALYADRNIPVAEIARRLGVGTRRIYAWREAGGWPPRKGTGTPLPEATLASSTVTPPADEPKPGRVRTKTRRGPAPLGAGLEPVIRREIQRLKSIEVEGLGPEQRVRLIRSLVQSLNSLRSVTKRAADPEGGGRGSDGTGDRKTLAELRDELYRHLLRIRHERRGS